MNVPRATGTVPVRRLQESDWAALRTARLTALADAPYAFSSTITRERAFTDDVWRGRIKTAAVYAAWSAEGIVGMATGRISEENQGWELVGMWVSPQWRGTGVADQLVGAVCEHVRRAGADRICLWVVEANERAIGMYTRIGFQPTGGRQLVHDDEPGRYEVELARQLS